MSKKYQETRDAKVVTTNLGIEDHGIFSVNIDFSYDSCSYQGTGFYCISGLHVEKAIKLFLKIFHVQMWENIPGCKCQVRIDDGRIKAIRAFDDDWTELLDVFSEDEPMKAYRMLNEINKDQPKVNV